MSQALDRGGLSVVLARLSARSFVDWAIVVHGLGFGIGGDDLCDCDLAVQWVVEFLGRGGVERPFHQVAHRRFGHAFQKLCAGEDVEATIVGNFERTGRLQLYYHEHQVGDLDMRFLHEGRPQAVRKATWTVPQAGKAPAEPARGVPPNVAVPSPLSANVTPGGRTPASVRTKTLTAGSRAAARRCASCAMPAGATPCATC